ncbi:MAG: PIN domain-containing protein [Patescibacteria group bacterium]|jgi:hypothetical protein
MRRNLPQIVFIDTNIFISCALEQIDDLDIDVLKKIENKVDSGKMVLVVPEVIEKEIFDEHKKIFKEIKDNINCIDSSKIFGSSKEKDQFKKIHEKITKSIKDNVKSVEDIERSNEDIIKRIMSHKNTKKIPLTGDILIRGMVRSSLKEPPWTENPRKTAYVKDLDCIAFESFLKFLEDSKIDKKQKCILCVDDKDYFEDCGKKLLNEGVKTSIKKTNVENIKISGYKNPLDMLDKEFKENYTEEQKKKFDRTYRTINCGIEPPALASVSSGINLPFSSSLNNDFGTFRISNVIEAERKFCPFCGKNIEKELSEYGYNKDSLNRFYSSRVTYATTCYNYRSPFKCPYCGREIEIN